jgi:hypothetical protein
MNYSIKMLKNPVEWQKSSQGRRDEGHEGHRQNSGQKLLAFNSSGMQNFFHK